MSRTSADTAISPSAQAPRVSVLRLGQAGFRFTFANTRVYLDPYLSDSLRIHKGEIFRRLSPPIINAHAVTDATWLLITHEHADHCDLDTIGAILDSSPGVKVMAPNAVIRRFKELYSRESPRWVIATPGWTPLSAQLKVRAVAAAHPNVTLDADGFYECVGFVFEYGGRRFYHSGDTSVDSELIAALRCLLPIQVAFLPINETNYFRKRLGIIGNMSIREAFAFADMMRFETVIPMHHDMFATNRTYVEELVLLYAKEHPSFRLDLKPTNI